MIDALYRSLGSLRAWVTFIIGAVAATATWRSPRRANAAAPLGAASSSLSHRKHTLPLLALLAAAALGLALLLPGGALQAQSNTIEYPENGKDPVATFTADDPEGSTSVTWWIVGATGAPPSLPTSGFVAADNEDGDLFEIDEDDGTLKFIASPDYETPGGGSGNDSNTYNVVVAAADGVVGATDTEVGFHKVTVKVTDMDEPGEVTWLVAPDGTTDASVTQFDVGGARLTATAEDGDISGATKTVTNAIWRWYRSPSATATGTLIDDANSNIYTTTLDDEGMYLTVVAHYVVTGNVDQETATLTSDYPVLAERIGANDLEFDPDDPSRSVAEGDKGANVGAPVTATGNHGAVYYTLGGTDAVAFDIDEKTGQITTALELDYEGEVAAAAGPPVVVGSCSAATSGTPDTTCEVTVTARDASGDVTGTPATVAIKITDVDEKPTFPATALTAITRMENDTALADSGAEATVTYTATDPESRNIVYTLLGSDAARFKLSGAQVLSFRAKPDYETPTDRDRDNVYEVTVRASDGTTHADRAVKVTVIGVDEAPVVTGRDSVNYAENGKGVVATFTASDPEGAPSITWSIPSAGDPDSTGPLDAADNEDGDLFTIDDEDGELKFLASPDYEAPGGGSGNDSNTYNVVVAAADAAATPQTGYHKVTVKVTNVSEPGKITWDIAPDGATDAPVTQFDVGGARLTATAEDGDISGATKTFTSSSDAGVTEVTWRWFRGNSVISGETTNVYNTVLADSGHRIRAEVRYQVGTGTTRETATLTSAYPVLPERVGDNELEFDPDDPSRSVAEGDKGRNVGAPVTATGNHGAVYYTLGGTDAVAFEIDEKTGQITTALELDYEGEAPAAAASGGTPAVVGSCSAATSGTPDTTCEVTVTARDASGDVTGTPATVAIKITDVDEKPKFSAGAETVTVDEGVEIVRADSTGEGTFDSSDDANLYVAADEDGLNVNLSLMGPDAADFSLSNDGTLSFAKKPDYEDPADANRDNLYEVTVRASDGTMHADRMVRVTVENVNEAPMIIAGGLVVTGPTSTLYEENGTAAVATYRAAGPDAASATWSLSGADAADFTITGGELSFASRPNYERPADANTDNVYEVTVEANDGTNTAMRDVTVTVTDVEELDPVSGYDANNNGEIEESEVRTAIRDYLIARTITEEVVRGVIRGYFFGL